MKRRVHFMDVEFKIGDRTIGPGRPCFVIAEAGVNHNGNLAMARELIDAAAEAGADAVKFQTWITEKICLRGARKAAYQTVTSADTADQFEMLKRLELPYAWHPELKARAERRGLIFLSTPDEIDSARFLVELGMAAIKIGSGEISNLPYLEQLGSLGLPVILSTGMSDLNGVAAAYAALVRGGCRSLALLHCVSAYPAPDAELNLRCVETLRRRFHVPVGFSDHTAGHTAALLATALGIAVLEKHLTLDRTLAGPDHAASVEPAELGELVRRVRQAEIMLGSGVKQMTASEADTRRMVARTLVYARDLPGGAALRAEDVQALRTGEPGLSPDAAGRLVGRTVKAGAFAGTLVREEDFQ